MYIKYKSTSLHFYSKTFQLTLDSLRTKLPSRWFFSKPSNTDATGDSNLDLEAGWPGSLLGGGRRGGPRASFICHLITSGERHVKNSPLPSVKDLWCCSKGCGRCGMEEEGMVYANSGDFPSPPPIFRAWSDEAWRGRRSDGQYSARSLATQEAVKIDQGSGRLENEMKN